MAENVSSTSASRANLAFGLGLATLAAWVVGYFISGESGDENAWIWFLMAALGLGAIVAGLMAREGRKLPGRALAGLLLGAVFVLIFLAFAFGIVG
jgi:uncharacterized membrane protein YhdT